MNKILTCLTLVLAMGLPASANCLPSSQMAVTAAQALNSYTIMRYNWQGDKNYDQTMNWCGSSPIKEPLCNAAFNIGFRTVENNIAKHADEHQIKRICVGNWLGAFAFSMYIRKAINVQIFKAKF